MKGDNCGIPFCPFLSFLHSPFYFSNFRRCRRVVIYKIGKGKYLYGTKRLKDQKVEISEMIQEALHVKANSRIILSF